MCRSDRCHPGPQTGDNAECLAIPGQILRISGDDPLFRHAKVSFGGIVKDVSLACTPDAQAGQYVLVHVGMALSIIDEAEAAQVFEYLQQMEELDELRDGQS